MNAPPALAGWGDRRRTTPLDAPRRDRALPFSGRTCSTANVVDVVRS
jgi:hypothetical protein